MKNHDNSVTLTLQSRSQNEAFARTAAAAFLTPLDPTIDELTDVKTAVSEAVTNAIIHGYDGKSDGEIKVVMSLEDGEIKITISDYGTGIENVTQAMEPLFTTKPEMERSGMGFTVIEGFMDSVSVTSAPGEGTSVAMSKKLRCL